MDYDPTQYLRSARHYLAGRPPHSGELGAVLAAELGLDGTGQLLDVGSARACWRFNWPACSSGSPPLSPTPRCWRPRARMQPGTASRRSTSSRRRPRTSQSSAYRLCARSPLGQSLHRTDRHAAAEAVYRLLELGGAIILVVHDLDTGTAPAGTGDPPIPDAEVQALITHYLGPQRQGACAGARPRYLVGEAPARVSFPASPSGGDIGVPSHPAERGSSLDPGISVSRKGYG